MKKIEFPIFKTKNPPGSPKFNLDDPKERAAYFDFKAGAEIKKIKDYLRSRTFLAILMGKKQAGKGTYTKMLAERLGEDKLVHISIGDIVRDTHKAIETKRGKKELLNYLGRDYRGYLSIEKGLEAILNRSTEKISVPDELILSLIKREIDQHRGKALFIDGFPRTLDQVSYSLFFRDLVGYRDDPDFLVLIDIPEAVIDERMRARVVCPKCHAPRSLKLLPTSKTGYDIENEVFYLLCDNPGCGEAKMVGKEGDELGIEAIRERLEADEELIQRAFQLHGIPKILLRNAVPVSQAKEMVDDYEITPEYCFYWNQKEKKVERKEKPWIIKDDQGQNSISLLAPPVVVSLIHQLADLL